MIYFISGHLDLSAAEFGEHYEPRIREANTAGNSFVVGDARGTDYMAQEYLRIFVGSVVVYHMHSAPRHNEGPFPTKGGYASDLERDAAMTAASDADIAWVRPGREKSGTAKSLRRRAEMKR